MEYKLGRFVVSHLHAGKLNEAGMELMDLLSEFQSQAAAPRGTTKTYLSMKTRVWISALTIALFTFVACDDDENDSRRQLSDTDRAYVQQAAMAHMADIEFGQVAMSGASDSLVRNFGEQMVNEHRAAQNELNTLANRYGNTQWPTTLDEEHLDLLQQLSDTAGYYFDSLYISMQVTDHQRTRDLFQSQVDGGDDPEITGYASKYLPQIEQHLQRADSISKVLVRPEENQE